MDKVGELEQDSIMKRSVLFVEHVDRENEMSTQADQNAAKAGLEAGHQLS